MIILEKVNVNGTKVSLINAGEFCPMCERENGPNGYRHYTNCTFYQRG